MQETVQRLRPWIMRLCDSRPSTKKTKGWCKPGILSEVLENARIARAEARPHSADENNYLLLCNYLEGIIPELDRMQRSDKLTLAKGVNVMDVSDYSFPLQALIVASSLNWIYEHEENIVAVIPEAWEMIPEGHDRP